MELACCVTLGYMLPVFLACVVPSDPRNFNVDNVRIAKILVSFCSVPVDVDVASYMAYGVKMVGLYVPGIGVH